MSETKKEWDNKKFRTDLETKSNVNRDVVKGEGAQQSNRTLRELGNALNPEPRTYEYIGSAAVHYYKTQTLEGIITFITQTPLDKVPEPMCQPGITDLRNTCLSYYGHKPQVKRSGF